MNALQKELVEKGLAKPIRHWRSIPWYERPWSRNAMQSLGKMVGAVPGENIVERIADLIDRPTCNNTLPQNWGTFECSECGAQFEVNSVFITAGGTDASEPVIPRYCPNCGAEVVSADD